jgi:membrane protein implicated in regulation of membrane protease activity
VSPQLIEIIGAFIMAIAVFFYARTLLPPFISLGIALGCFFFFVLLMLALAGVPFAITLVVSSLVVVALVIGGSMTFPALRKPPQFSKRAAPDDDDQVSE